MSETANVMTEEITTEVASVDWTDDLRVVLWQRSEREDYSIEQAETIAGWLLDAAAKAREVEREQLADLRARLSSSGPQSGGEPVL